MAVKKVELQSFFRGDTPVIVFPFTRRDNGQPFDLSSYFKVFFTMTANPNPASDSDALFQKIVSPIPNPTLGVVEFQLDKQDTQSADPSKTYYWDLQMEDSSFNRVFTPIYGTFTFLTDYTRTA